VRAQAPSAASIAPALLSWASEHGRHDLPWQIDAAPYRVWVSEVMLQQTQVANVIPYYERFMSKFPTVRALAQAPLDAVLHIWTGLGYYARARNLHRAARAVVECHDGCLPEDIQTLQALPGIGRSTAGAILALSCGQRHAILDGNARRVLARVFGVEGDPGATGTQKRLWDLAEACTPQECAAEYTQAIMDLGAGVCRRTRPDCDACPLGSGCVARRAGRQHELPSPRRRGVRPPRTAYGLVVRDATGALLLCQRPTNGVWGGLWSLPQFETEAEGRAWLAENLPFGGKTRRLAPQAHAFTHYDLTLQLRGVISDETRPAVSGCVWYDVGNSPALGLSKAVTMLVM
jgi:A/G-specific adenine glycosylase